MLIIVSIIVFVALGLLLWSEPKTEGRGVLLALIIVCILGVAFGERHAPLDARAGWFLRNN